MSADENNNYLQKIFYAFVRKKLPKWSDVDLEPVAKSTAIWNSINATEERKHYYALVAKDLAEMDAKLEKDAKPKKPKTN